MTEQPQEHQSIGALVSAVVSDIRILISDQVALFKAEIRSSVRVATAGAGFFGVAVVFVIISLFFLVMALVHGFNALGLPLWASYLAVAGILLVVALIFAVMGRSAVKKVKAPSRSMDQIQETLESFTN